MIKVAIKTVVVLFSSLSFASGEFHYRAHDYECIRQHNCKPLLHLDLPEYYGSSSGLEPFMTPSKHPKTDAKKLMWHTFNHIGTLALDSEWLVLPHVFYAVKTLLSETHDIPFNSNGTADQIAGELFSKKPVENVAMPLHERKLCHV